LSAEVVTLLACLVAGSIVGWIVYMAVERPIMLAVKRRAKAAV
jgi:hypothetical protein